jgi:hypothetical protein
VRAGHTEAKAGEKEMTEPFTKRNVARMAERAAGEIENLRRANQTLAAKADAYDTVTAILGLLPKRGESAGEDLAWKLRKYVDELCEPEVDEGA